MSAPKVSVCVPTRNFARFLATAVQSALTQDFSDLEVLVVDNCSADNTEALMRDMCSRHAQVHYYRNDRDLGLIGNLNRCLELARGDFIKFLLADDLLVPGCVGAMASILDADQRVALVTGGRIMVDEAGNRLGMRRYSRHPESVAGTEAIQRCLFSANHLGEPTAVMFRRRDAARGFRSDYPQLTDMEMWFHLLEKGKLASLPEPVCCIRMHGAQLTNENIRSGQLVDDNVRLFEEFRRKHYIKPTYWNRLNHKARMAYRVWVSRRYLSPRQRKAVIREYSNGFIYFGMAPAISVGLRVIRLARSWFVRRSQGRSALGHSK